MWLNDYIVTNKCVCDVMILGILMCARALLFSEM